MPDLTGADLLQAASTPEVTGADLLQAASAPAAPIQTGGVSRNVQPAPMPQAAMSMPVDAPQSLPSFMQRPSDTSMIQPQGRSFEGFLKNATNNLKDIGEGIGALSSATVRRFADRIVPTNVLNDPANALQEFAKPENLMQFAGGINPLGNLQTDLFGNEMTGQKPLFRVLGNQTESSDIPAAVNAFGNLLQDVAGNYIDPAMTGNFDKIVQHAYEQPFNTAFDAFALAGPAKSALQGGISMARKIPAIDRGLATAGSMAGAATNTGIDVAKTIGGNAIQKAATTPIGQKIVQGAETVIQNRQLQRAIHQVMERRDKEFRAEYAREVGWVKEAYDDIPKNVDDAELTNAITMRDPEKYGELMNSPAGPAVQKYMDRLSEVNKWLAGRLIGVGAMTEEEAMAATYGPYALKKAQQATGNPALKQAELTAADYEAAAADLDAMGVEPVYLGIVPQNVSNAVRANQGLLFGGIGKNAKKMAEAAAKDEPIAEDAVRASFATPRVVGNFDPAAHEANSFNAFATRATQELAFLNFSEALGDIMNMPKMAGPNAVNFPLKANLQDLAKSFNLEGSVIASAIAEMKDGTVKLPQQIAKELDRLMTDKPNAAWAIFFDFPRRVLTTTTLGLNPAWAVSQNVQNATLSGYAMFKGPQDFARSVMAYVLAADKRAASVAQNWLYDTHAERAVSQLPTSMGKLAAKASMVTDAVFGLAQAGDNYFRVVKGLHTLMREIEMGEPASRVPLAKAFNLQARFDQIEKAASNPKYAAQAVKEVDSWFGNYGPAMADKWRTARSLAPYWLWWMHSFSIVKAAAVETPVKNAVLARMLQAAPDALQKGVGEPYKDMGMVPQYDLNGEVKTGPNDKPLMMGRSGFLPIAQPIELVEQGYQLLTGNVSTKDKAGLPPVAPVIGWVVGMLGKNPQNLSEWKDPRMTHTSAGQFEQQPDGTYLKKEPHPNAVQLAVRSMMPTQEAMMRDFVAGDMAPSDFTNPMGLFDGSQVAVKRDNSGEVLKNYTPLQKAFYWATRLKPTEATIDQAQAEAMNEKQQRKVRFVAEHFQSKNNEKVPTVLGKMLKGYISNTEGQ